MLRKMLSLGILALILAVFGTNSANADWRGEHREHEEHERGFHRHHDRDVDVIFGFGLPQPYYYYNDYPEATYNSGYLSLGTIVDMSRHGMSDAAIIRAIRTSGSLYYLTSGDVAYLQQNGVSERVIDYMLR